MAGSDLKPQDAGQILQSVYNNIATALSLKVSMINALITSPFDYIGAAYPTSSSEVYTYKLGGASGTLVGTITVAYTDATKTVFSSMIKV